MQKPYLYEGAGGILHFVLDFFFGNTFDASWFLGALIVGVPIYIRNTIRQEIIYLKK